MLATGSMPFPPGPLVCISSTASFVCVSNTGSVFRSTVEICHVAADSFGDHHVGCGGNGDRIFRHDSIRDAIFSAAQSAALAPRKEFPSLIPGCHNRPADVFLPHWDRGLPTALDISVISILQQRTVHGAAENQGYALSICEERKMATHAASCREVGVSFIPLAVESLGGWSDLAASQDHQPYWSPPGPETWHPPLHHLSPTVSEVLRVAVERECCPVAAPFPSNLLLH